MKYYLVELNNKTISLFPDKICDTKEGLGIIEQMIGQAILNEYVKQKPSNADPIPFYFQLVIREIN